jgi:hypothetical protein
VDVDADVDEVDFIRADELADEDDESDEFEGDEEDWEDEFDEGDDEDVAISARHNDLYQDLLGEFSSIPGKKKADLDEYGVVNTAPAIVPNPYTPSFRIISYNVSSIQKFVQDLHNTPRNEDGLSEGAKRRKKERDERCRDGERPPTWKCRLDKEWHSDERAPSRTNTLYTPLGFAQVKCLRLIRSCTQLTELNWLDGCKNE